LKKTGLTDREKEDIFAGIKTNSELLNNQNRGADCALY